MNDMFSGTEFGHENISKWGVSRVKDGMCQALPMFQNAKVYNGGMCKWYVFRVMKMDIMC